MLYGLLTYRADGANGELPQPPELSVTGGPGTAAGPCHDPPRPLRGAVYGVPGGADGRPTHHTRR